MITSESCILKKLIAKAEWTWVSLSLIPKNLTRRLQRICLTIFNARLVVLARIQCLGRTACIVAMLMQKNISFYNSVSD